MMTRHMRNAVLVKQTEEIRDSLAGVAPLGHVLAPVAIAFTEDEIQALARMLRASDVMEQLAVIAPLDDDADDLLTACEAITTAADDLERDEHEPPLHEEDA